VRSDGLQCGSWLRWGAVRHFFTMGFTRVSILTSILTLARLDFSVASPLFSLICYSHGITRGRSLLRSHFHLHAITIWNRAKLHVIK